MLLNPAIIALSAWELLLAFFAAYAAISGLAIARRWDPRSGSELQLTLERRTYLLSTILGYVLGFELLAFFLFIYTADGLHHVFTGAMCAAGVLNVDGFGYPVLLVRIVNLLLGGAWLTLNYADNQAPDYPLAREKYRLLPVLALSLAFEAYLHFRFFAGLRPDVVTSCCGTLFTRDAASLAGDLASMPPATAEFLFFASLYAVVHYGVFFLVTGRAALLLAAASLWFFVVCGVSILSFISLYYYAMPTHHCPFCLLQAEYHHIGYPLYLTALLGGVTGTGIGVLQGCRRAPSLAAIIPRLQRRLCLAAMASFAGFAALAVWPMICGDFKL
jgi:hypothetical protein